ncbi:ATP-binding protein [Pseudomonas sp. 57B-090624]|uniref:ATP-binding protein n=1 Tax=Pseudomonas sp. 57B-090624 TaxID=2213080 RepID=UPI000DA80A73|nr:ATP-binding protein [Pseudomonas sp. 57B-090624]PZE13347.1 ATP-binding protein [Pseudomonas sp. 57B-090624]
MPEQTRHLSLFEEDYLLRELGPVAHVPQVALTELVANAWDAGASKVELFLPSELGGTLTILDDGHGMTPEQFSNRWMMLRYNRLKHQSWKVEFPKGRSAKIRKAYGRNGVGRHGLLCFGDEYLVETWRDGTLSKFVVGTESGPSPFVVRSEEFGKQEGSGTKLRVTVVRKLPDAAEISTVLAARFIHDPSFQIRVNGTPLTLAKLEKYAKEQTISLSEGRSARVIVIDSTQQNHSSIHQGVAFWVDHRLVGNPSWAIGQVANFDGRTRFAKRYKVIVDTHGFDDHVHADWTGFKATPAVDELFKAASLHITQVADELAAEVVEATSEDALVQNRSELKTLGQGAQLEVTEFTKAVAQAHPLISPDFLATAVKAVINLEKSKSGAALLQKLAKLSATDVEGLDSLLADWSVKDALRVLDEIDDRLSVIEVIARLADDPDTDELHTLHPLILRSRWLFGPEFESMEYCSNMTLRSVAKQLWGNTGASFINEKKRPDVVVLPDQSTVQLVGIEGFQTQDPTVAQMQNILLIELKKGGFKINRKEVNQADGYVQDIANSGFVHGAPYVTAWVVGQSIAPGVGTDKKVGDETRYYGQVRATTYGALVSTANLRLMRLRKTLENRYDNLQTDALLAKVLSVQEQADLDLGEAVNAKTKICGSS